ncbi:hypothetical protein RI129_000603 [Pyrocoelia pectoralis]|uniref:CCHC-type domain-containing protein n=1 Tax=Pyrocoelia pectoralis TaxID=417401 RepID=A0AAN7VTN9_9COLE
MSDDADVFTEPPLSQTENWCRKCKKKVSVAYIKCINCDKVYHRSCVGKNFEIINENELKCHEHRDRKLSKTEAQKCDSLEVTESDIVKKLRLENEYLKIEVNKLKLEINTLKSQIQQGQSNFKQNIEVSSDLNSGILSSLEMFKNEIYLKLEGLHEEIKLCKNNQRSSDPGNDKTASEKPIMRSYSDVTKNKEVVVTQPKKNQTSSDTLQVVQEILKPHEMEVGITQLKKLKNGSIVIGCNKKEEINKLQNEAHQKLGNNYSIKKLELQKPKIKIIGITEMLNVAELKDCIEKQNPTLKPLISFWKMHVIKKMKTKYMAIVETDVLTFHEVCKLGQVNIKWGYCKVFEHFSIRRCLNCGGYKHSSLQCKNGKICLKCSEKGHELKTCTNDTIKCVNYLRAQEKLGLQLNVDHTCFDRNCKVYQRYVEEEKRQTNYTA